MTALRFGFQAQCVRSALDELPGLALNVGCNDDPAPLKPIDPERVINCDLFAHDQVLDRPNAADVLFDCAAERWPFDDGAAALVVLGDIVEHLHTDEIAFALCEARRVSARLCVTVPCDDRDSNCNEVADRMPRGAVHRTIVTEELLRGLLAGAGWTVSDWQEVEYDSGAFWGKRVIGFFLTCE